MNVSNYEDLSKTNAQKLSNWSVWSDMDQDSVTDRLFLSSDVFRNRFYWTVQLWRETCGLWRVENRRAKSLNSKMNECLWTRFFNSYKHLFSHILHEILSHISRGFKENVSPHILILLLLLLFLLLFPHFTVFSIYRLIVLYLFCCVC